MVREPKIRDAAQVLREQLAEIGFTLPNQKSLDIAAKMKGYAGYQMYSQLNPDEKASKRTRTFTVEPDSIPSASDETDELPGFGVEQTARKLAEVFGLHDEWSRYDREDWQHEVANGYTNLGYWEWCVHQAESDFDIQLHLAVAYLLDLADFPHLGYPAVGWAWVTTPGDDVTGPPSGIYEGPFSTYQEAQAAFRESHPLTKQNFIGNVKNLPPVGPAFELPELAHGAEVVQVIRQSAQPVIPLSGKQLAQKLEHRFQEQGEWSRFPLKTWSNLAAQGHAGVDYWEWCVAQSLLDTEVDLKRDEVFYIHMDAGGSKKTGYWWTTTRDWSFLRGDPTLKPADEVGGPFSTERVAREQLMSRFPLAEQRFMGTVHLTSFGPVHVSR